MGWVSFIAIFLVNRFEGGLARRRAGVHLIFSTLLAVVVVFSTIDDQGMRSLQFLSVDMKDLATGAVDPFRDQFWKTHVTKEGVESHPKEGVESDLRGLHNVYFEFFLAGGKLSFLLFIIFQLSLLLGVIVIFLRKLRSPNNPMYLGILLGLVIILGELYANPVLHLRFIWVFYGLILAVISFERNRANIEESNCG
jgi:hypothetical protein